MGVRIVQVTLECDTDGCKRGFVGMLGEAEHAGWTMDNVFAGGWQGAELEDLTSQIPFWECYCPDHKRALES